MTEVDNDFVIIPNPAEEAQLRYCWSLLTQHYKVSYDDLIIFLEKEQTEPLALPPRPSPVVGKSQVWNWVWWTSSFCWHYSTYLSACYTLYRYRTWVRFLLG